MTRRFHSPVLLSALLLAGALLLALAWPAAAQESGVIEGSVVHGGTGQPLAGATVTLDRFEGMTAAQSQTAETDSQGRFRFEKLPLGDKLIYVVRVAYAGVEYPSDMLTLTADEASQSINLKVFETSEDGSGVSVERAHLIVREGDAGFEISEMVVISNSGAATYVGKAAGNGPATTLDFYLPQGYSDLAIDGGELGGRFVATPQGFADTQPVRPGVGVDQIVFSYRLPAQSSAWTLEYRLAYPAKALNILVAAGWVASGDGVTYVGAMGGEAAFLNYQVEGVSPNTPVRLTFAPGEASAGGAAGAAKTGAPSSQATLFWIAGVGLLIALAAALTYPVWRKSLRGGREA